MIWGGFCAVSRTKLVLLEGGIAAGKYADHLIGTVYSEIHVLIGSTEACLLQDDNAPPHTARVSRVAQADLYLRSLVRPAQSPDCSIMSRTLIKDSSISR